MFCARESVGSSVLLSNTLISSAAIGQGPPSGNPQPTVEQLTLERDELRREIRGPKSKTTTAVAPESKADLPASPFVVDSRLVPPVTAAERASLPPVDQRMLLAFADFTWMTGNPQTVTPYFTENPRDPSKAYDTSATVDWILRHYDSEQYTTAEILEKILVMQR